MCMRALSCGCGNSLSNIICLFEGLYWATEYLEPFFGTGGISLKCWELCLFVFHHVINAKFCFTYLVVLSAQGIPLQTNNSNFISFICCFISL